MKVLVTGSFDPVTLGHMDIIERARALGGELLVCVMVNQDKHCLYTLDKRVAMLRLVLASDIVVDKYVGWCYDYCADNGIDLIVRGYRSERDLAYEEEMAAFNEQHCGVKTKLLKTNEKYLNVSSSVVKQRLASGEGLDKLLDKRIIEYLRGNN